MSPTVWNVRDQNQDSIYEYLVSNLNFPEPEISDMLRSKVVYAVSCFDKFIHIIPSMGKVAVLARLPK